MSVQTGQNSVAYLPPAARETRFALAGAGFLLVGLAVLAPLAAIPMPEVYAYIPALDAIIFITDLITAGLLFAHFSATGSRALLALACGYLFSAAIVVAHGLTFPGPLSQTGYLNQHNHANFRIYVLWHLGLPVALFIYAWFRNKERTKIGAHAPAVLTISYSVMGMFGLAIGLAWLAIAGESLLPSALTATDPVASRWITLLTMLICVAALFALWLGRRSALDQWLMVVMLASIIELAITSLIGGLRQQVTLGFYGGRVFSLVTSTVVLTALLAETSRLYARLANANMLASVVKASQTLSGEIELSKLIERLMTVALENSGVDRGCLILPAKDGYVIQAAARAVGNRVEVSMRQEAITPQTCPESLVRYVIRTRTSVLLDDESESTFFSEKSYHHLHDRQAKSIFCLPLLKQGELNGILVLESSSDSRAFTAARIAVVELLAAQGAISLENTRLYRDVQEREAKVRRLIDSNFVGILIGNLDGHIEEANEAFLQIVGCDHADVEAGRLRRTELTPPEWHDRDTQAVAEMRTVGIAQPYEKEYFRKDGSRVPVLVGGAAFGEARHAVIAFVVDLTERKRAESELAHANRVATMGQLTASIAHEVSQPVTGLLLNAQIALRTLDRQPSNLDDVTLLVNRIIRDGKLTADIISRIRDFSRKAPQQKALLGINDAISEIMGLAREPMVKSGVSTKMQLAEELPHVFGDRVQLQQVILNLTMNAIEAMSEVGNGLRRLSIRTSKFDPDFVLVAISDTGPGLPTASLPRIFEAFYTTKSTGLGMGLSICRSIVESHGGRLWVTQNEPTGAVFNVMLPIDGGSQRSIS